MIFVTVDEVDAILGGGWTTTEKKPMAVNQANVWLSAKKFCRGIDPVDDALKEAGAYLAQLSANDSLYVSMTEGVVAKETVSAQTGTSVSTEYVSGKEQAKSADILFIEDIIKPFLCGGVGKINGRVCK